MGKDSGAGRNVSLPKISLSIAIQPFHRAGQEKLVGGVNADNGMSDHALPRDSNDTTVADHAPIAECGPRMRSGWRLMSTRKQE